MVAVLSKVPAGPTTSTCTRQVPALPVPLPVRRAISAVIVGISEPQQRFAVAQFGFRLSDSVVREPDAEQQRFAVAVVLSDQFG